ncbi:hypothetical protein [Nesterenkonia rhizosphaerae]|uniref:Uncharacterized protein n=1 Tax=Nesterenkonia rhizosphaerae TaxID=1348272 RepID=A0ABP9G8W0_9MICC
MSKTGGGRGTNQHKIRGASQAKSASTTAGESVISLDPGISETPDLWGITEDMTLSTPETSINHSAAEYHSFVDSVAVDINAALSWQHRRYQQGEHEELYAAKQRIIDKFGGEDRAIVAVGERVAARAEELAGMTSEQARQRHAERLRQAQAAADQADQLVKSREECGGNVRLHQLSRENGEWEYAHKLMAIEFQAENGDSKSIALLKDTGALLDELGTPPSLAAVEYVSQEVERYQNRKAQRHVNLIQAGVDDESREDLAKLAAGYREAVAEVRETGGDLTFHERSQPKAVAALQDAAQIFPADWVKASNERIGTSQQRVTTIGTMNTFRNSAPVAKFWPKKRVHYNDLKRHEVKKKRPLSTLIQGDITRTLYDPKSGRSTSPYVEYRPLPDTPITVEDWPELNSTQIDEHNSEVASLGRRVRPAYVEVSYERDYSYRNHDERPRGTGWEWWTDPTGEADPGWRRKEHRMSREEIHIAPEIAVTAEDGLPGVAPTLRSAAHELTHRMEYSVPGLSQAERAFYQRRTEDHELSRIPGLQGEYYRDGGFPSAYMGKDYSVKRVDNQAFELMSCGMEALYGGGYGGLVGVGRHRADEEYRAFVLGTLATVGRTGPGGL